MQLSAMPFALTNAPMILIKFVALIKYNSHNIQKSKVKFT